MARVKVKEIPIETKRNGDDGSGEKINVASPEHPAWRFYTISLYTLYTKRKSTFIASGLTDLFKMKREIILVF
jgi:hypothetical protein